MDDVLERANTTLATGRSYGFDSTDPDYALVEALAAEVRELRDLAGRRAVVLGFFRSVIMCGEPWTDKCQLEYDAAMASRDQ